MKQFTKLRKALIATLTENNAHAAAPKPAGGAAPKKPKLDAWGLTDELRRFIGQLSNESNSSGVVALSIHATHPDRFDWSKAYTYTRELENALGGASSESDSPEGRLPGFPTLTAVKLAGEKGESSRHTSLQGNLIPDHRRVIVTHQIKGHVLNLEHASNGVVDALDGLTLLTKAEIIELVDTLTQKQLHHVLTHSYFASVRQRAGLE